MSGASPSRRRSQGGRLALILAAEKLIALHGLSGASLREMNEAAGLRNVSAAHYHFGGSRDEIVEGVLAHRLPVIHQRRMLILDEMAAAGTMSDPRSLISALVWPLVEEMRPRPEGNHYLRFIEHIKRARGDSHFIEFGYALTQSWAIITSALRNEMKHLPDSIAALRIRLEYSHIVSCLASVEAWIEQGEYQIEDLEFIAENLIDSVVSALFAPASEQALERARQR